MYTADALHPNPGLQEKLLSLYSLQREKTVDLGFRPPYLALLEAMGAPHRRLPPCIHVAGTNGKGSVIAMLRSMLECAGYRVHVYTSPHLVRFNERIVLAGREITDEMLETLLDEALMLNGGAKLTFFEITTALAFAAFARHPADILLLETGLGGRLDCTNVIDRPLMSVITAIGYDHMEFLGESLAAIAGEKAGIMKRGIPCVIAPQPYQEAQEALAAAAHGRGIPLLLADPAQERPSGLAGPHQLANAATALACLPVLSQNGFIISEEHIDAGLQAVRWPARLQKIAYAPLPDGCELWIDGGHNEGAGKVLAAQAGLWREQDGKPLHLVLGMMTSKDPQSFIAPLLPYLDRISCVSVPGEAKAFAADDLAAALQGAPVAITAAGNLPALLGAAREGERILIAGSLYLAGHALKHTGQM